MISWILDFLLTGLAILLIGAILPGVKVKSYGTALWVAFLIGLLDATIGFILRLLTFPLNWLTLGLIYFVIYVVVIILVDKLVRNFEIKNFMWTVIFAILLSLAGRLIDSFL